MPDQQEFPTFCTRFLRGCWCHLGSTDESRRTFHLTRVPMKELLRWKTFPPMDGGVFHRRSSFIRTLVRWKVLLALHRWRALHKAQGTWMCRETMVVGGWWFSDIAWIIILFDLYDWQRRCQQLEPGGKSRQYCFRDFRDFWTDLSCRRTNQCSSQRSQRWVGIEMDHPFDRCKWIWCLFDNGNIWVYGECWGLFCHDRRFWM